MISGPFAARLFARLGADVIKIERPGGGDPARNRGPHQVGGRHRESGPLHLYVNEGKRGITLDLESPTGRDFFLSLVCQSDLVIENLGPGELEKFDLEYRRLAEVNPGVVLTSISDFGADGPYRDFRASELTLFALGGHMYRSGDAGRPPLRMGGWPAEYMAGLLASFAAIAANRSAEYSGSGQHVTFSIFENQVISHAQAMVEVSYYGTETGADLPRGAGGIRGVLARDGLAMVSAQEQQMRRLAELIDAPAELGQPDPMDPVGSRQEINEHVARWAADLTKREVYERSQAAHVPASFAAEPHDLLESPQYRARDFLRSVDHPDAGRVSIPGLPFGWEGAEIPMRPAPRLGEHTAEVFEELLDLPRAQLPPLAASGVI
jgi:crotonobetainyl-CoA:carnitine CoA-transferase CaiB-like acyl-CoA transferase